jgi:hypothetical protein
MTLPGALLGWLLASVVGLVFHLVRGGSLGRMTLYLVASWMGFFTGHFFGEIAGWHLVRVGSVNLFPSLLGALVALLAVNVLAGPERKPRTTDRTSLPPRDPGSED